MSIQTDYSHQEELRKTRHPGLILKDKMFWNDIYIDFAVQRSGLSKKLLEEIIAGKTAIDPVIACKIEKIFAPIEGEKREIKKELCAEHWITLQLEYEIAQLKVRYLDEFQKSEVYKEITPEKRGSISVTIDPEYFKDPANDYLNR